MKKVSTNNTSLVPNKSNSLVRVQNDIDITNRLILEMAENFKEQGDFKRMDGDYDGAIKEFTKATELNPDFALAYYSRGSIKMELMHDSYGAIEDFTKAIELNPSDYFFYLDRGSARIGIEDYKSALEDFNTAIEKKPNYAVAYKSRSKLKQIMGDTEGANCDIEKFNKLNNK